jgi:DNA polymerase I-like protein with 3'-5' exonuclease and polymerase domains
MVPANVVMVRDGVYGNARRRELYPEYKKKDRQIPEAFFEELSQLREKAEDAVLDLGGIVCYHDAYEADDMIAALAAVTECIIWSNDKDMLAYGKVWNGADFGEDKFLGIPRKNIHAYRALIGDPSDNITGVPGVGEGTIRKLIETYGDDALDDLADMLENKTLHELDGYVAGFKPFRKIIDNADAAYLSWKLVKPIHPGFENIIWMARPQTGHPDFPGWSAKNELVTDITPEFLARFRQEAAAAPMGYAFDIETWQDEESIAWGWANKSKTDKNPKIDVRGSHLAGFSITVGTNGHICYYFPVAHYGGKNISLDDATNILNQLDPRKPMYVWNSEFELPIMRLHCDLKYDRGWLPNVHDALIMKSYVNENTPLGLKDSSMTYLGYKQISYEEVTTIDGCQKQMNELPAKHVLKYGADDSICTLALASLFDLIMRYEGTMKAFELCELAPAYLVAEGFVNGQKFDMEKLAELAVKNEAELTETLEEIRQKLIGYSWSIYDKAAEKETTYFMPGCEYKPIFELTGRTMRDLYTQLTGAKLKTKATDLGKIADSLAEELPDLAEAIKSGNIDQVNAVAEMLFVPNPSFNPGSPKDMEHLLYTAFQFPVRLRGKATDKMKEAGKRQGNPKANESAIRHAIMYDADDFQKEVLLLIIKAKGHMTERSLYYEPYRKMPNPKTGLVHGSFGQSRQTSRRFSSTSPNRTQLAKDSEIRKVYIPYSDDHLIVSLDEAGQELRHAAVHSGDTNMLSCFIGENKKDIHSITGRAVMEKWGESITYEGFLERKNSKDEKVLKFRAYGKVLGFLSQYGGTDVSLAEKLLVKLEDATQMMEAKDAAFPGLVQWQKDITEVHTKRGYAITPLGGRKHLTLDGSWKDAHELRSALNFVIQSGSAEQIKLVMAEVWRRGLTDKYDCGFLFPCHDEVVFSVAKKDVVEFCRELHQIMTQPYGGLDMPWESSIEIGPSYGELNEFSEFDEAKIKEFLNEN